MNIIDIKKIKTNECCQRCFQNLGNNNPATHMVMYKNFGAVAMCDMHTNRALLWNELRQKALKKGV